MPHYAWAIAFAFLMRLITGMGTGGSYIPMIALPTAWFAARKRGLAAGIVTLGTGTGLSIAGLILPCLIGLYGPQGWRYAWCLLGVIVFLLSFVCYAFLRDTPAEKGLAMYGGTEPQKGCGRFTLFPAWKEVAAEREIWKLGIVYFMNGFCYVIYLTFIIAYLAREVGLTPKAAGAVFAVLGVVAIFCGVIWGTVSDVIGRRYATFGAYLVLALASLLIVSWRTPVGLYLSAIIFGLTAFAVPVIMAAAVGDAVGGRLAPAALGFITLFFGVGQALGPAVAGWLRDSTGTFTSAFVLSSSVALVGAGASFMLKKRADYPPCIVAQDTPAPETVTVREVR